MVSNNRRVRKVALREKKGVKFVEVFQGNVLYSKLGRNKDKYSVDLGNGTLLKAEMLSKEGFKDKFFYVNPDSKYDIHYCEYYDDFWFLKSLEGVSRKSDNLALKCLKLLEKDGIDSSSLITFIKKKDKKYHLVIDKEDYGFLDNDDEDLEFKQLVYSVIKEVKCKAEVIVFPSKGDNFFFTDTLAVYDREVDFLLALDKKDRVLNMRGISEKEVALDIDIAYN